MRTAPYHQGELDYLCGVYAIVNAVRRVFQQRRDFGGLEARWLFQQIVKDLDRERRLKKFVIQGQTQADVRMLLGATQRMVALRFKTTLTYQAPFHGRRRVRGRDFIRTIRGHLARPRSAVLIRLSQHWSVVDRVVPSGFVLFDSWRLHKVSFRDCAMGGMTSAADDPWLVQPSSLFLLGCADEATADPR